MSGDFSMWIGSAGSEYLGEDVEGTPFVATPDGVEPMTPLDSDVTFSAWVVSRDPADLDALNDGSES